MRNLFAASLAALTLATYSSAAHATLTPAESAQVGEWYSNAKDKDAASVRAMVARPDLTADESASSLSAAVGGVAFTPARAAFLHSLVFGGQSLPSRSVLALATTKALMARVNDVISKDEGDFDAHADAVAEVTRVFAWLDKDIAAAGPNRGIGGPPESGIAPATYDECAKAIGEGIGGHPRWLKADAPLSLAASKVRAQAELAFLDMMNDSPTFRVDAADKLGLAGIRRTFFLEVGVLPLDDSKTPDHVLEVTRDLFLRMPAAKAGVSGIVFGDGKPGVVSKKEVIAIKLPTGKDADAKVELLPEDLAQGALPPVRIEAMTDGIARDLAAVTVRHALVNRGDLALLVTRDARAAIDQKSLLGKSPPPAPLPADATGTIAEAVEMCVIDVRAAFDIARNRFRANRPEPAALFSDALGILAVGAQPASPTSGLALALGHAKADGTTEPVIAQNVTLAPNGGASSLAVGPWVLSVAREASGEVTAVSVTPGKTMTTAPEKNADAPKLVKPEAKPGAKPLKPFSPSH
ncbi:MAG TPA: hypothetical protein VF407_20125 [Polyangiaceae bacterium]